MKQATAPKKNAKAAGKKKATALKKFSTVNEYIASLSEAGSKVAKDLRKIIQEAAPKAEEMISYNMPLYKQEGMLVSFAVWKDHIGIYPLTDRMESEMQELAEYKGAKHTLKFPLSKPLPLGLIKKVVKFRVKENLSK